MSALTVAGVDLSAEPTDTYAAVLTFDRGRVTVVDVLGRASNADIVERCRTASKIGIDSPFGWPIEFVDFLTAHTSATPFARPNETGQAWRTRVTRRATDRHVRDETGANPMSVAADKLGLVAMRCTVLLDEFTATGRDTRRDGLGDLVEVYPGAALKDWGFASAGYKQHREKRDELVDAIQARVPQLDFGGYEELCRSRSDPLDAVIAGLIALAAARGLTTPIPDEHRDAALREGWIALPAPLMDILA